VRKIKRHQGHERGDVRAGEGRHILILKNEKYNIIDCSSIFFPLKSSASMIAGTCKFFSAAAIAKFQFFF
jgi:hypothetical protein